MKPMSLVRIGLFAAVVVLLGSCTPDGGTIYASIETETKTVDNSLPNTLTIGDLVRDGTNTYYVAAGQLYKGVLDAPSNTVTWTSLTTAPAGGLATTLAFDGTTAWGGFITAGSVLGLYSSTAPDTVAFAPVADPTVATKQVYAASVIGPQLYLVCAVLSGSNYVYELERETVGSWAGSPLVSNVTDPIVGVAFGGAPNYFMASGGTISAGTGTDNFPTVSLSLASGDKAQGIFGDTVNHRVFVVTKTGGLYYTTNDGGAWTNIPAPVVNSTNAPLLSVAGPIDAGADKYLVGSDGFGYFIFSVGAGTFTRFGDSTVAIYSASIRRILVDGSTVLMGTNGAGLWRASFDSTGTLSSAWTHE